jgi:hypothetical protein
VTHRLATKAATHTQCCVANSPDRSSTQLSIYSGTRQ